MKKNITLINTATSIVLQLTTLISGFIIPRLILNYFGSEVNGLVSSITQLLGYIYLIEGGITGVLMSNLYKPLYNKDYEKVSSIIKTADNFFKKISLFFIGYTIILAIVYPTIAKTSFNFMYVSTIIIILSISLIIQYAFSLTYKTLLNSDKKVYIVSTTQAIIQILNIIICFVSLKLYPSIHLLKFLSAIIYIIQPIVYNKIIRKNYIIDKNAPIDKNLLKSRWNGFAINVAAFIHFNTDITILVIFTNLKTVSVYAIYNLIVSGLRQIISSISSALYPTIGYIYAKGNNDELNDKFNLYELIIFFFVYLIFTVAIFMITPFVELYTQNISDVTYSVPMLGYIMLISEMMYLVRSPHINIAYAANKFKEMTWPSILEAILNIILSVILINKLGVIGVAIGTLISMLYRTTYQVLFLKKHIIYRNVGIFIKKFVLFTFGFMIIVYIGKNILDFKQISIGNWVIYTLIYSILSVTIYSIIVAIFYNKEMKKILKRRLTND